MCYSFNSSKNACQIYEDFNKLRGKFVTASTIFAWTKDRLDIFAEEIDQSMHKKLWDSKNFLTGKIWEENGQVHKLILMELKPY